MRVVSKLLILATLLLTGCGGSDNTKGGSGLLEADEAVVSAETAGRVISIGCDEGNEVRAGDTLVVIDPSRLELQMASVRAGKKVAQAQLEAARAQMAKAAETELFAQSERDRIAKLLQSGTATQKQMDQLEFELKQAELSSRSARAAVATVEAELMKIDTDINRIARELTDCYLVAPVAGMITKKYVEVGELLSPGKAVVKISRLNSLWVKVYLPAGNFANVKIGDSANIDTESGGRQYRGAVVWMSEEAEFTPKNVQTEKSRANLVYAAKVRVENSDGSLKIGMPVYVTIGE